MRGLHASIQFSVKMVFSEGAPITVAITIAVLYANILQLTCYVNSYLLSVYLKHNLYVLVFDSSYGDI